MDENINIPLSSKINSLDNDSDSSNLDEFNNIDETNLDININLDEILSNQILYDNYFIQDVINDCNLNDKEAIPNIHTIAKIYGNKIYNNIFPKNGKNKFILLLIRLIHILGIIFILLGCFLPNKILKYHIIFCIKTLVLWEFLNDKCYLSLLLQKVSELNLYPNFIPEDISFCKNWILGVMFISIFSVIIPDFSLFKIISKIIYSLKKYD